MKDLPDDISIVHDWIYVITPVDVDSIQSPLFAAFCKQCRNYFSEVVAFNKEGKEAMITKSNLPKYGCVPIDDVKI